MPRWGFWEWLTYGAIFIAALISAADGGLRSAPEISKALPTLLPWQFWSFAPLGLLLLSAIITIVRGKQWISGAPDLVQANRVDDKPVPIDTSVRIEFFGDDRVPVGVLEENVSTWYALWSPSARIQMFAADGEPRGAHNIVPKSWSIFVVFDRPTEFRQVHVAFSGGALPPHEVKLSNARCTIVSIAGDVPAGLLTLSTIR